MYPNLDGAICVLFSPLVRNNKLSKFTLGSECWLVKRLYVSQDAAYLPLLLFQLVFPLHLL